MMTLMSATRPPSDGRAAPARSLLSDAALPAARFLSGPDAIDILRPPVEAAGGILRSARLRNVQYRPGCDVVVRYSVEVSWSGQPFVRETHMASSTAFGGHPATVPVVARLEGEDVSVGVWRWPFDPVLTGLERAATPRSAAALCGIKDLTDVTLQLVAFRPTVRAVFQLSTPSGDFYLKVVPPHHATAIADRHSAALAAGVPAARVISCHPEVGVVVLAKLAGTMLRDIVKSQSGPLPPACEFDRLGELIASVPLAELSLVPSRSGHALLHASMLASVMPGERAHLDDLSDGIRSVEHTSELCVIHGDLHEGQLLAENGRITGVLDLDDLGIGSATEERANVLGFLRYRAVTRPKIRAAVNQYADGIREASTALFDPAQLDAATAAVLVGLATGPFRVQQPGWQQTASSLLDVAERHLDNRARA